MRFEPPLTGPFGQVPCLVIVEFPFGKPGFRIDTKKSKVVNQLGLIPCQYCRHHWYTYLESLVFLGSSSAGFKDAKSSVLLEWSQSVLRLRPRNIVAGNFCILVWLVIAGEIFIQPSLMNQLLKSIRKEPSAKSLDKRKHVYLSSRSF